MPKEELTREQEIKMLAEFIKKNGATQLPPDERLLMDPRHVWGTPSKIKVKKPPKKKNDTPEKK
jgi:hypothetical protein